MLFEWKIVPQRRCPRTRKDPFFFRAGSAFFYNFSQLPWDEPGRKQRNDSDSCKFVGYHHWVGKRSNRLNLLSLKLLGRIFQSTFTFLTISAVRVVHHKPTKTAMGARNGGKGRGKCTCTVKSVKGFPKKYKVLASLCGHFGMVRWPFQWLSDLQLGDQKVTVWITGVAQIVCTKMSFTPSCGRCVWTHRSSIRRMRCLFSSV